MGVSKKEWGDVEEDVAFKLVLFYKYVTTFSGVNFLD